MPLLLSALINIPRGERRGIKPSARIMYFPSEFIYNLLIVDKLVQAALAVKSFNRRNSRLPSSRR